MSEVEKKVKQVLFEITGNEIIARDNSLQDDLDMDSLLMVTMLVEIEEAFNITLDESDMNPFDLKTVKDVIDLVEKYCGVKSDE